MKIQKIKPKKASDKTSKIKKTMLELSRTTKPFHRSKFTEAGVNPYLESLIKHFFLEKDIKTGYWKFSTRKIQARGYKSLKDLYTNEGFFRVDLLYLLRTKNGKVKVTEKRRKVNEKDLKISENLFNLTYSL